MTPPMSRLAFLLTALLSTMRFSLVNPFASCVVPKFLLSSLDIFNNPLAAFYGPLFERCLRLPDLLT